MSPRHCETIRMPGGGTAILCGDRGRLRIVCDICDGQVKRGASKHKWRNTDIDLCAACGPRYDSDPAFRTWADHAIELNLAMA